MQSKESNIKLLLLGRAVSLFGSTIYLIVLPCSAYLDGEYGHSGFYTGVPAIIGSNGVEEILELPLDERERKGFEDACVVMKKYIEVGKSYKII